MRRGLPGPAGRELVYPVAAMTAWFATISNRNG
jgi:hypothetical protein